MKQKDIAIIIIVAFFSGVVSFLLTPVLFVSSESKKQKTQVIEPIQSSFKEADKSVFNDTALNPTKLIRIGDAPAGSEPF